MPTQTKPPAKPEVKATRKALLAYHSELQKYHEKLDEWEELLSKRQAELIEDKESFEALDEEGWWGDDEEDGECECGPSDALDGCECKTCGSWREFNPAAMRAAGSKYVDTTRRPLPASLQPVVGDEVQFLEKLFELKDKRRKPSKHRITP